MSRSDAAAIRSFFKSVCILINGPLGIGGIETADGADVGVVG